jgi:hypothetical protein
MNSILELSENNLAFVLPKSKLSFLFLAKIAPWHFGPVAEICVVGYHVAPVWPALGMLTSVQRAYLAERFLVFSG